jgi:molybdate transport system regulatory protein
MKARLTVWVVFGDRVKFGDGRARLLQLVDELGSLRRALEQMGMSYRAGWGYLRELERAAGMKLLEPKPGGRRGGTRLTRQWRLILDRYRRLRKGLEDDCARRFKRTFRA